MEACFDYDIENLCPSIYDDVGNIAEEKFLTTVKKIGKSIWDGIKLFIRKAIQIFKNFLLNIYMFKTAKLSKKESEDIQLVSQSCSLRYMHTIKPVYMVLRIISKFSNSMVPPQVVQMEKEALESHIVDCRNMIHEIKTSKEYNRLIENKYDNEEKNLVDVPLTSVISTMKKAQMSLINYENCVDKLSKYGDKEYGGIMSIGHSLFSNVCTIYRIQIEVLNRFFAHAKASMSAIAKNVKEIHEKKINTERLYASGHKSIIGHGIDAMRSSKNIDLEDKNIERIKELFSLMAECDNDINQFGKYQEYRKELCALCKIPYNAVINPGKLHDIKDTSQKHKILILPDNKKPIKLLSSQVIYHTSDNPNLTELNGRYIFRMKTGNNYFKSPRVYFAIGTAILWNGKVYKDEYARGGKS